MCSISPCTSSDPVLVFPPENRKEIQPTKNNTIQFLTGKDTFQMPSRYNDHSLTARIAGYLRSDFGILLVTALTILVVYAIDTVTPLGEPVWLLYFSSRLYCRSGRTGITRSLRSSLRSCSYLLQDFSSLRREYPSILRSSTGLPSSCPSLSSQSFS